MPAGRTQPEAVDLTVDNSTVLAALEAGWRDIQKRHPEVPPCAMVIATGGRGGKVVKLGHWWEDKWSATADQEVRKGECLIASESLNTPAEAIFGTLLHEAAHALASARGIQDVSRGSQYHNKKYKVLAEELGMEVQKMGNRGWAHTQVPPEVLKAYASTVEALRDVLKFYKRADAQAVGKQKSRMLKLECSCGRVIRAARSVITDGGIHCSLCDLDFEEC